MAFDLHGKVAIVTGGASGIGLFLAKELLEKGAKGVTIADINPEFAKSALKEIEAQYGPGKAIFVHTDISEYKMFENAFTKTIEIFKNVDILVNNGGIYNENIWEREIAVNLNGTIHGMLLGLEHFLPNFKQTSEALIINTVSTSAIYRSATMPIYGATKSAVMSLTQAWGRPYFYEKTKVRVIALCPGVTQTPRLVLEDFYKLCLEGMCRDLCKQRIPEYLKSRQSPTHLAKEAMKVMENAPNGSCWIVELGSPAYECATPAEAPTSK